MKWVHRMEQTTANEPKPSADQPTDAPAGNKQNQAGAQLSASQLQALAKKVYQLLYDEMRLSMERQGR